VTYGELVTDWLNESPVHLQTMWAITFGQQIAALPVTPFGVIVIRDLVVVKSVAYQRMAPPELGGGNKTAKRRG
jgi:hypothetical protein